MTHPRTSGAHIGTLHVHGGVLATVAVIPVVAIALVAIASIVMTAPASPRRAVTRLAPIIVQEIFRIIDDLRSRGVTILLIEQNANLALRHSDRAYVLETGEISMSGVARDLLEDDRVREAYLG